MPVIKKQWLGLASFIIALGVLNAQAAFAHSVQSAVAPRYSAGSHVSQSELYDMDQGSRFIEKAEYLKAIPYFSQVIEKTPNNLFAYYDLGACYYELSQQVSQPDLQVQLLEKAEQAFLRVESLNPELVITYFKLGKIAIMQHHFDDAQRYYEKGLALDPNNGGLEFNLAGVLEQKNQNTEAMVHYQAAIQADPELVFAYNNLGMLYEKLNRYADAEKTYKKALKKEPTYTLARLNLGSLYADQDRLPEAKVLFEETLKQDPKNSWAPLYLGNVYYRSSQFEAAIKCYQQAVENNPGYPMTYYLMAVAYTKLHQFDSALNASLEYLNLDPNGNYAPEMKSLISALKFQKAGNITTP